MITVQSTMSTPPGGKWFWQDPEHSFAASSLDVVVGQVGAVLRANGDRSDPEQAVLAYMAPRMPRGWATGWDGPKKPTISDYVRVARKYFGRRVSRVDRIKTRMDVCRRCPAMSREMCLTCSGVPAAVTKWFSGQRPPLPGDGQSGICRCASTFNMVVASVDYDEGEPVWDGAPPTCWRYLK